jgi:hypothetical protein
MLTVLRQKVLEVVEIETLVVLGLLCEGNEEANEENDDHEENEGNGVLEGTPYALSGSLLAMLCRVLIVLLVPEVGEGYDDEAEKRIERVQGVVDNLEGAHDVVDLLWRGPVLLLAQA